MTDGLRAETLRQIYTTLGKCMAVSTQARLRALFVDSRIAQWRGIVPEADNRSERIYLLVDRLLDQQNAQEQSALALFLWVVSDNHETSIKHRRDLRSIAQAVTYELGFAALDLSSSQSVGRDAPATEPVAKTPAPMTSDDAPPEGKRIPARKRPKQPALWQTAAQWWSSSPIAGRRALAGVGGVALVIWLAVALAKANAPTPTMTPQATAETVEAIAAPPSTATPTPTITASPPAPTVTPTRQPSHTPTPRPPTATPSLTPPPTLGIGSTMTSTIDGMVQVYVPAGPFTMGSDNGDSDEKPVHTVTLDAFWIDRTEVTNSMYAQCVAEGDCQPPGNNGSYNRSSYYGDASYADYPVIYVSWNDARAYCEWTGRRLPTEAEWEKAARGTDGRTYPWGEEVSCEQANYNVSCVGDTTEVGSYPDGASPYGALDMAGNVWEWTLSLYQPYPYNPDDGRENLNGTNVLALRGGSWFSNANYIRAASRLNNAPAYRSDDLGFRCAQE